MKKKTIKLPSLFGGDVEIPQTDANIKRTGYAVYEIKDGRSHPIIIWNRNEKQSYAKVKAFTPEEALEIARKKYGNDIFIR